MFITKPSKFQSKVGLLQFLVVVVVVQLKGFGKKTENHSNLAGTIHHLVSSLIGCEDDFYYNYLQINFPHFYVQKHRTQHETLITPLARGGSFWQKSMSCVCTLKVVFLACLCGKWFKHRCAATFFWCEWEPCTRIGRLQTHVYV